MLPIGNILRNNSINSNSNSNSRSIGIANYSIPTKSIKQLIKEAYTSKSKSKPTLVIKNNNNTPDLFINDQQLALTQRTNTINQDARLEAETNSKTGVLNKLNSNHESKSLIQNAPDFFINEQQLSPLSASRIVAATKHTGVINQSNGNHESESLLTNAPEFFINDQPHAPLPNNNNTVQVSHHKLNNNLTINIDLSATPST